MYCSNASQTAHNYNVMLNAGREVMFKSMQELRNKNKEIGHIFFDHETMKFWNSKVETGLYRGTFFITSEKKNDKADRKFFIRRALSSGEVITEGNRDFKSLDDAKLAVKSLLRLLPKKKKAA